MKQLPPVSIIVPAKNEELVLPKLCREISAAMGQSTYEIILVNDHSTDKTAQVASNLSKKYPLKLHNLKGATGKSAGILAGLNQAKYDTVAFIDADLQYSPRAFPEMLKLIGDGRADVVVANRIVKEGSYMPSRYARFRNFLYRVLFGIDSDVQSGLKVFQKAYMKDMAVLISNPWSLDAQFLYFAKRKGASIGGVRITYDTRDGGDTKNSRRRLNAFRQIYEAIYLWAIVNIARKWS